MRINWNKKGFTLIELLIVVAIIGIIAAIAIPNLLDAMNRARFKRTEGDIRSIGQGVELYKVDHFGNPPGDADITALMVRLLALGVMKQAANLDGFGKDFVYSTGATAWPTDPYAIGSGAYLSGQGLTGGGAYTLTGGTYTASDVRQENTKTWQCDIVFSAGNLVNGSCT